MLVKAFESRARNTAVADVLWSLSTSADVDRLGLWSSFFNKLPVWFCHRWCRVAHMSGALVMAVAAASSSPSTAAAAASASPAAAAAASGVAPGDIENVLVVFLGGATFSEVRGRRRRAARLSSKSWDRGWAGEAVVV